jgi:hypothetical protein
MRSADAIEQLRAELRQDILFIEENCEKNREMTARVDRADAEDEFQYAALGYTLHNLYNALESYFYRVAKFFENELGESDWHKTLVDRMTLEIDGIRPALIDLPFARRIDELRRFRHLFRNLYKTRLIPAKVRFANEAAAGLSPAFRRHHERFDEYLRELKRELQE